MGRAVDARVNTMVITFNVGKEIQTTENSNPNPKPQLVLQLHFSDDKSEICRFLLTKLQSEVYGARLGAQ